jgi:predicted MFS family arabinose efflux permease
MAHNKSLRLALGGMLSMAAAFGIGRFVYTPILPAMLEALGWSKAQAGLVASSNFLGYLVGAIAATREVFFAQPRKWLLIALAVSTATTMAMALHSNLALLFALRFVGGAASAFVIVCASTLILERLSAAGRGHLSAVHFAGVGVGTMASAVVVDVLENAGTGWRSLWIGSGLLALFATICVPYLIRPDGPAAASQVSKHNAGAAAGLGNLIAAYGLFGFGYVITATFLVTIVRQTAEIRPIEPWIWILFGLAAIPSVAIWSRLGTRIGLMSAFGLACLIEAIGVAATVEWVTIVGVCLGAVLLGGTYMGITALGLMAARDLSGGKSQRAIGQMTASFAVGQMIGPTVAGVLFDQLASFRVASLLAAAALLLSATLAVGVVASSSRATR